MLHSFKRALLVCVILILTNGCSVSRQQPMVITAIIKFDIDYDANPNEFRRPSPVVVAMHQLKNGGGYLQTNSIKLFQNPAAVLRGDIISTQRFGPYFPGTQAREKIILNDETTAIGFLAELSNTESVNGRSIVYLRNDDEKVIINVSVNRNGITTYRRDE